jgi:hypothetical protein
MVNADSNPLRVLGVSNSFDVLQNAATLVTYETQFYEGEWIDITYTMSEGADNFDGDFAWLGLFAHNVSEYSDPKGGWHGSRWWATGNSGTIRLWSRNLPMLNSTYKAVMVNADSNPLRILGVSNSFDVLQNAATLVTYETQYYEGEWIDITYTMSEGADNFDGDFAWVGLFAHNVSDYSDPKAVWHGSRWWATGNSGTIRFLSRNLPMLDAKYKAVMVIADSNPLRVLGVSNTFDVLQNVATLVTYETQYYEGEWIDITYAMSEGADNFDADFAWVALFAYNVSDYSDPKAVWHGSRWWATGNTGTIRFRSRNLPMLNSTYKAVMAIADSNPLRILGVSNTFDVLQNAATLVTDETQYYEGERIDITYTMSEDADNIERDFAWVALFAHDASDFSLPPAALQSTGYWWTSSTGTLQFWSGDLQLNSKYKAVMAITDSSPLRILGVSSSFQINSGFRSTSRTPTMQPTTASPSLQPTTLPPTKHPTTLSPAMKPVTLPPTLEPVVCPPGTFTKDCLRVVAIESIFPSAGLFTGGFVVRVKGFNFGNFSSATVMCQFGASIVTGTYKSESEVTCVAPDVSQLGVVVEESAVVSFNVSINGLTSFNSVTFEYFGLCRREACVNGFCSATGCICDRGFRGESCSTAVIPPRVKAISPSFIQVQESNKFSYLAIVDEGDLPLLWKVAIDPPQSDVYMNPSTGALEWQSVKVSATGKPYEVTISAENSGGSDSVTFQLEVLSEYFVDGVKSTIEEVSSGPDGAFVPIEGYCRFRQNRSVVPFCEAEILIVTTNGFRRTISTVARQDGKLRVSFVPFDEEGGTFYLGGQPKGFRNDTIQDSFSRFGLAAIPRDLRIVALTLEQIEESVSILSLSDKVALGDLSVSITTSIPSEIQNISIQLKSIVLPPNSKINVTVKVVSRLPGTFVVGYKITSNTTAFATGRLSMGFQAPTPVLVAEPPSIGLRAARGARSVAQIILKNSGGAPTGDLQTIMPANFHLLQLASHSVIPSILPGESATILFSSLPSTTEPFQSWTGALVIQSTAVSLQVDFRIEVVSNLVGSLVVITEDEATFHKEGNPPLNTSTVTIKNAVTLLMFRLPVDATGSAVFANVTRGVYEVRATAPKHGEFYQMIEVTGADQIVHAFLPMQVVSYTWSVNPITFEEVYEIVLESTFTTFVPAPVITIEPNELDLATLVPGEDQINFKITNHGFIAANDVLLNLPPTNGMRFVPLLDRPIGDLPANTTIYYPVKVEYSRSMIFE